MEHKKKYVVKLSLLFGLLCCLLLGCLSTTCYADMSSEYLDYAFDLFKDNYSVNDSTLTNSYRNAFSQFSVTQKNEILTTFNNYLANNNLSSLTDVNFVFFVRRNHSSQFYICIYILNNGANNNVSYLDHFLFKDDSTGSWFYPYTGSNSDFLYNFRFTININSSGVPLIGTTNTYSYSGSTGSGLYSLEGVYNSDNTFLTLTNIACAYIPTGFCYVPLGTTNSVVPVILKDVNGNYKSSDPEEPSGDDGGGTVIPSGDNSGDSGGGSSSIDYTNQLNNINTGITNIQNQISGDSQKIIDNQNNNTQAITSSIDNLTDTLTADADMDNTTITSGDIERGFRL